MKLTPAEQKAMNDFWAVYDAHYDTIMAESLTEAAAHPEFGPILRAMPAAQMEEQNRRSRALMRDALLDAKWEPYLADLRSQGAGYAKIGVSFQGWFDLLGAIRTPMARHLIAAYRQDPERLASATDGLNKLIDIAMAVVGDEYLRMKEKLISEHAERLAALRSIDTAITSSLDRGLTLNVVLDQIITHLRVDGAAVLLFDPRTQTLDYAAGRGFRSSPAHPPRLRLGEDLPGRAALERRTLSLPNSDAATNATAWSTFLAGENFTARWCVPLIAKGEVKGVLEIVQRSPLPTHQEWIDFLEALAAQTAIALDNAALVESLQRAHADLTQQKQAEVASRQAREEAERANRTKSEFLSRMSHELRTPLNAIIGFSDLLLERIGGDLTAKQEEFLRDIRDSGAHLLTLINDVLDISKIEAGRMELTLADTDVAEVVESALTTLRPLVGQKHLDVSTTLDPRGPVVRADKVRLKQILYNLLSNAAKFTPEGGQIRVESHRVNDELELAVVDTGPGIAPADQAKLFQEFTQLQAPQPAGQPGTGLGLALVKRLTELHGGRVWLESEVGKGSRFIVRLPIAAGSEVAGEGSGPIVMIVEDDPATQRLFRHYLSDAGYRTAAITDGPEVVAGVKTVRPAVICLDIRLPGMEDWEVLRRLKEDPATAPIPIVAITMLDDAQTAFTLGAAQFLVKPVSRDVLLDAVSKAVRTHAEATPTVLVVDDDPSVLASIPPILTQAGYRTVTASGGTDGIAVARQHLPHLIVLDLLMPEVSGFDVLAALRSDIRTRGIPVLVLTAKDLTREERAFLEQRVQGVSLKTSAPGEALVTEVTRVLAARPQADKEPLPSGHRRPAKARTRSSSDRARK